MFLPEVNKREATIGRQWLWWWWWWWWRGCRWRSEIQTKIETTFPYFLLQPLGSVLFDICFGRIRYATISNLKALCLFVVFYCVFIGFTWYQAFSSAHSSARTWECNLWSGRATERKLNTSCHREKVRLTFLLIINCYKLQLSLSFFFYLSLSPSQSIIVIYKCYNNVIILKSVW